MLQNMREKSQGLITWLIVLFIVGAFAFFGLTDYFSFGKDQAYAAKVGNEKISWRTVDTMYDRLLQQYGNQVDPNTLKEQVRMGLVQRAALMSNAKTLGFRVGNEQVANALLQIPAFQENGKFSKERYLKILADAAYTDVGFRQELSHDILLGQLEQGIAASSFTMPVELSSTVAMLDQKRNFGYFVIPAKKYESEIKISAEDSKAYYELHKDQFTKPEQISLEYITLSLETLSKQIDVSKEQVLAYYNEHQSSYTTPERIRVRHILIGSRKDDPKIDKEAREKAEALLNEVKQNGSDFPKLAKQSSIDRGSAEKGGDLGWFTRGQMVPEFEKAAFELKKEGELSGVVETKFGYHLIQMIEHKNADVRPFTEAQALVEEQLKLEKAQILFAEKSEQLAKLTFEQATSLVPAAESLGLKIQETELFTRVPGSAKGFANDPEVLKAAFSEAVLKQRHNSEVLKLTNNAIAVVRLKTHQPVVQQTLETVEKQIQEKLASERAKAKVKIVGEAIAKRITEGDKPLDIATQENLEWKTKFNIARMQPQNEGDRNINLAAFQIPSSSTPEKPGVKGFVLPSGDYVVLVVTDIKLGEVAKLDSKTRKAYHQSLTEVSSQLEFSLYANQVLKETKIEIPKGTAPAQN
jgi:peptidyl-prolyl cis-trans isomerase D